MIRQILAANVADMRDQKFAALPKVTSRNRAVAKLAGTTLSQIQRIAKGAVGTSVDQLEHLARALDCKPHDLLTPYFVNSTNVLTPAQAVAVEARVRDELQRRPSRRHAL